MGTVYVVNPTNDDISAAKGFGEIKNINHRYVFPDDLVRDHEFPPTFLDHIYRAAEGFSPHDDYFLIVGDHLQQVVFAAALSRWVQWFRVLRYDRETRQYVPITIHIPD